MIKKTKLRNKIIKISVYSLLLVIIFILNFQVYKQYREIIVEKQLQNMLGLSQAVSRGIKLYTDSIIDSMRVVTLDESFKYNSMEEGQSIISKEYSDKLKDFYSAERGNIDKLYFLNEKGSIIAEYPQRTSFINNDFYKEVEAASKTKKTYIGMEQYDGSNNVFKFNIYEPVIREEKVVGVMAVTISMETIYDKLISPTKIGEKGYVMVKNHEGIIIMHPVMEQVGMDVIDTRKQLHPNLDFKELENLIEHQLNKEEGTAVYDSYWWGDKMLKKVTKLNAYTPLDIGNRFWVIATTMSYNEIQGPITEFLFKVLGITGLMAVIVYMFIYDLIKTKKYKEELIKETEYLKNLNELSEQLRKKEGELYHSNKLNMIGTLAGGIAHDINNLMTPILGYSEFILMRMPKDNEYFEEVEEIYKASVKGKELTQQILSFTRSEKVKSKVEAVNIKESVMESITLVKSVLPKKITINEKLEDCGYIMANFTQIHQIIFNLCTNAYQAVDKRQGVINITLRKLELQEIESLNKKLSREKSYLELTIQDNGRGMEEEVKSRIFDPFYTTKARGEGTGLGLFVVHNILEKYGGSIEVYSKPGEGSSFKIYLPLASEDEMQESVSAELEENFHVTKKKILIVDDNKNILKLLKKELSFKGYEIITETDSKKALAAFESQYDSIDLVITDYIMPKYNGIELAEKMKNIKSSIGIVLLTGYIEEGEKINLSEDIIDAHISKPIALEELLRVIQKIFKKSL
ncbi:ATP-binding protein [Clostridium polynesiense]|uniref:ATP-binding protein n=1 Tax=Clostridium polynesiense TaxID=1325933 RepID=UPI000A44350D|nr:ATP-binding protein [Clostridium polynesiense]